MKPNLPQIVKKENQRIAEIMQMIPEIEDNLRNLSAVHPNYSIEFKRRQELSLEQLKLEFRERVGKEYQSKPYQSKSYGLSRTN